MPIFLFMIAGAMITGGYATLDKAKKETARKEALQRQEFEAVLLERAVSLDDLRTEARRRGLDPVSVVAGYTALADGSLDVDAVSDFLRTQA
jgi:hypothetical protein